MKYLIWSVIIVCCYAYAQFNGYYAPSFFGGSTWQRQGPGLNHK